MENGVRRRLNERERNVSVQEKEEQFAFVARRKDEPERRAPNTKGGSNREMSRGHEEEEEQRWMRVNE